MPIFPPTSENIQAAAERLKRGELVAFATETVYGLGAHALDEHAVAKIYATKGRPATNPLIVHVADEKGAQTVARWDERAARVAARFWPGPLTLVLPKQPVVPGAVSAGLETVAVRVPSHPVARRLLEAAQIPVAAPSANRSMHISPTRAEHVIRSLGEEIWVLEGGDCAVGLESTVLDLSGEQPAILRQGAITEADLTPLLGPLAEPSSHAEDAPKPSPGMMERHYAPQAKVHIFPNLTDAHFHAFLLGFGQKLGVISFVPTRLSAIEILMPTDAAAYAQKLYAALHELDAENVGLILIEQVPSTPEWAAIRDRISRAAK